MTCPFQSDESIERGEDSPCIKTRKVLLKSGIESFVAFLLGLVEKGKIPRVFLLLVLLQLLDQFI